jgi:hypothetical protein
MLPDQAPGAVAVMRPEEYVGNPHTAIDAALSQWRDRG